MNSSHDRSRPAAYLDEAEFDRLQKQENAVKSLLKQGGFPKKARRTRVQKDVREGYERKSAVSPYEVLRARFVLRAALRSSGLKEDGGVVFTVGLLHSRLPLGTLGSYSPAKAFRKWNEALRRLRDMGLAVTGVCVFEVDLCRPLNSAHFYEPHLHGVIWGASVEQLKEAFVIRKFAKGAVRNRPKDFRPLNDLSKFLGYMTKIRPWVHIQSPASPKGIWNESRIPDLDAFEWRSFMSRYRVAELFRFHGIDGGNLGADGADELAVQPAHMSRGGPKGAKGGPSWPRKRP